MGLRILCSVIKRMAGTTGTGPVCVYDFTWWVNPEQEDPSVMIDWLEEHTKKWSFQLEHVEGHERSHFQGRFSLKLKQRMKQVLGKMKDFPGVHLSPTSKENSKNDFYVTKEETRKAGPWSDQHRPVYIPMHLNMKEWRPWQQAVIKSLDVHDARSVNVIHDPKGNIGKSVLALNLTCQKKCNYIPLVREYKDIMRMVMDMPKCGAYIIDLPRAVNKSKMDEMWGALETVKSGYAYDDRYSFRHEVFDSPVMWVFTNSIPSTDYLSKDRWAIWGVDPESLELIPLNEGSEKRLLLAAQPEAPQAEPSPAELASEPVKVDASTQTDKPRMVIKPFRSTSTT